LYITITYLGIYTTKTKTRHEAGNSYPNLIIHPVLLEVLHHLPVVLAHVLGIPSIAPLQAGGESGVLPLERDVAAAHDALAQVFKAMSEMPGPFLGHHLGPVGRDGGEGADDGVQAVQLVGHGGGECAVRVALERVGEVVVVVLLHGVVADSDVA